MKKFVVILGLVLVTAVFSTAQSKKVSPDFDEKQGPPVSEQKNKNKSNSADSTDDFLLESGTSLDAKLLSTLDVKKAEVGDEVVLKTTKTIKQNGEVVVPKGTKLIGRITEVQRKTKENATSKVSMVFEKLQNKDLSAPLNASIVSITNVAGNARVGDTFGADTMTSSRSTATANGNGSGGGGGLLGGVNNTVGGVVNTTTNTVGGVTNTVGNTVGGTTNTVGRTVNGIQISQSANASASGSSTLSVQNKDLRLEKGTTFQLQVNESIQN